MLKGQANLFSPSKYFSQLKQDLANLTIYDQKSKILNDAILHKIQTGIMQSEIQMPSELGTRKLDVSSPKKDEPPKISEEEMLKSVQLEKNKIMEKMRSLEKQQFELKMNIRTKNERERMMYRSEVTEDDKRKLKQLVKSAKNFEKGIRRKNRELEKQQLQRSLQDLKNIEKEMEDKRQKRRSLIIETKKSQQLKEAYKKQEQEEISKKFERFKQKRYLYEQIMDKEKEIEQQNEAYYSMVLNEVRSKSKLNIKEIQEHQKKYDRALEEFRQRSYDRMLENSLHRNKSYGNNYYRSLTKRMIEQQKMQEVERMKKGQIMKQKILKFQQEINKKFKPKISEKSRFKVSTNHTSAKVLSMAEQNMKGAEYLEIAKKLKDVEKEKEKRKTHGVPISRPEYKNYIQDLNLPHYETDERRFKNAVRGGRSMSDYDSAIKAVELAQKIQAKSKKTRDQKLVNSVKHKLQILQALD